jgi:hypothetical protein
VTAAAVAAAVAGITGLGGDVTAAKPAVVDVSGPRVAGRSAKMLSMSSSRLELEEISRLVLAGGSDGNVVEEVGPGTGTENDALIG